jgi:hypothetical protein
MLAGAAVGRQQRADVRQQIAATRYQTTDVIMVIERPTHSSFRSIAYDNLTSKRLIQILNKLLSLVKS